MWLNRQIKMKSPEKIGAFELNYLLPFLSRS